MSVNYNTFYESYIEDLKEKANKAVQKAQKETFKEFFKEVEYKINDMYKDVVADFYNDYDPIYYGDKTRGSLYNLISINRGDDYLNINFDPSKIPYRDGSGGTERDLYDLVFRKGYHGGATRDTKGQHPNTGVPYWRTPEPFYSHWGRPAEKARISPLMDFKLRIHKYKKYNFQQDYEKIWNKNKSGIKI